MDCYHSMSLTSMYKALKLRITSKLSQNFQCFFFLNILTTPQHFTPQSRIEILYLNCSKLCL